MRADNQKTDDQITRDQSIKAVYRVRATGAQRQSGSALIVALILVLVSALLGVSSMQSSTVELQLINNEKAREETFRVAERVAESVLVTGDTGALIEAEGDYVTTTETINTVFEVTSRARHEGYAPLPNASINLFRNAMVSVRTEAKIDTFNSTNQVWLGAAQIVPNTAAAR